MSDGDDLNPQARQMADESMVRTLAAQAEAIWPQERLLFERYGLAGPLKILDAGCGTGEISLRLAELYPEARVVGVDLLDDHLRRARRRAGRLRRVSFQRGSIFGLGFADDSFDVVACRHVLQAVPHPERALEELIRVVRPGGRLHVLAEDYGMMLFPERRYEADEFWQRGPMEFGRAVRCDLRIGRRAPALLESLGLEQVSADYVVVDTLRVSRETIVAIWDAWRDGYAAGIAGHSQFTEEEVADRFDDMIDTLRDSGSYAVWLVPVVAGVVPYSGKPH